MEDYKSNSHKSKENSAPEKKVEKIISGSAKTKQKTVLQKFVDGFIAEDVGNVKSFIFDEVLIPSIRKAVYDIITNGAGMILGESGRSKKHSPVSKISYNSYYPTEDDRPSRNVSNNFGEVIVTDRREAQEVLSKMDELISVYGVVSVGDLYDMVGIVGNNYTDNNWGWKDIRSARIVNVRDGYLIKLPKALPIN